MRGAKRVINVKARLDAECPLAELRAVWHARLRNGQERRHTVTVNWAPDPKIQREGGAMAYPVGRASTGPEIPKEVAKELERQLKEEIAWYNELLDIGLRDHMTELVAQSLEGKQPDRSAWLRKVLLGELNQALCAGTNRHIGQLVMPRIDDRVDLRTGRLNLNMVAQVEWLGDPVGLLLEMPVARKVTRRWNRILRAIDRHRPGDDDAYAWDDGKEA